MYGERLDCVIFMAVLFYPINFTIKNIKNQIFFKTFLFILLIFQKISIAIVNCMAWPIKNEVKKKLKNKYWAGQTKKKKKKNKRNICLMQEEVPETVSSIQKPTFSNVFNKYCHHGRWFH